jgi:hypothetical protein
MSKTWSDIYLASLRRGDDHGYAAYLAEMYERKTKKQKCADLAEPPKENEKSDTPLLSTENRNKTS